MAEPVKGFAVAAVREHGTWRCTQMDFDALDQLDSALAQLRTLRSTGATIGLLCVDDEFFVIARPGPAGASLLLSDSSAALDYDVAADVLDVLRADAPDEDDNEIWPEGDLGLLADLGLPEGEMHVIVGDVDLYPDEQLQMIAQRCGFVDEFDAVLDKIGA